MPMIVGNVTIAGDGGETKSGMAGAIYDGMKANFSGIPAGAAGAYIKTNIAGFAVALAGPIVNYIVANAEAVIPTGAGGAGLQRTPDPNDPNTATLAPAAEKTLAIR